MTIVTDAIYGIFVWIVTSFLFTEFKFNLFVYILLGHFHFDKFETVIEVLTVLTSFLSFQLVGCSHADTGIHLNPDKVS